jgi:hypothetical protein
VGINSLMLRLHFVIEKNPVMELESPYKDIATFRLVVRQFAIKMNLN